MISEIITQNYIFFLDKNNFHLKILNTSNYKNDELDT